VNDVLQGKAGLKAGGSGIVINVPFGLDGGCGDCAEPWGQEGKVSHFLPRFLQSQYLFIQNY
jgi:hypothetical protein